jgi:PhnB protein
MTSPARPRITPELYYADVAAAVDFLTRAFGFSERDRFTAPDGRIVHTALDIGGGAHVTLGQPGPDYRNPKRLGQATQSLYILVDDVDAVFARAKAAGATVLEEPKDQFYGDRRCGVADPEGFHWYFAKQVREVSTASMHREVAKGRD